MLLLTKRERTLALAVSNPAPATKVIKGTGVKSGLGLLVCQISLHNIQDLNGYCSLFSIKTEFVPEFIPRVYQISIFTY